MIKLKELLNEAVNEVSFRPNPGTMSGGSYELDKRKYELKTDVKGVRIGDYTNVTLPKGTIIYNLPGGVFAHHPSLKRYEAGMRKYFNTPTFRGISITREKNVILSIEKNSKILESVDKSKLKKVYDNLNKGDEVTIKYGSSISRNNEVTFIVKKGKTTVGKSRVERITLVNKANPKGVKYYLYNRNGNVSLAIGDMAATIDDIQMNESVNEAKDMAFVDYLKVLDDKFLDGMKAVRGDNGSDAQIKPTRGDILQNFTLFRNYLSALTKKYKGDKTKLRFLTERANRLNEIIKSVNEVIKNGDVIIFKKSKGEVPKIKYNSYSKQFAADFISHTDYYKNLKDAITDMKNAGFVIDKYIQTESVNEANDTYFKAAYEAAEYAREMAEKKGYEIDEDDWQTQIGMGGKHNRLRPGVGKTHSFSVGLTKNGKPQRKALNISLYGMDSGSYELTYYIN